MNRSFNPLQADQIGTGPKPQLSRREREEIEKQKAKERYQKLHAQGKTEEARADLARLAIIRKQREDAAKKRAEEQAGESVGRQSLHFNILSVFGSAIQSFSNL